MDQLQNRAAIEPPFAGEVKKQPQKKRKGPRRLPKVVQDRLLITAICLTLAFAGVSVYLLSDTVSRGATAANAAYISSKEDMENGIYQRFYDAAEARYHTSNEVSVTVENVREEAKLEVLKVADVEYIIQDGDKSNHGITSWLEVPGEGVFAVDLQASEFVVDSKHHYVLARIPSPILSECRVLYQDVVQLEFKNDMFNDNIKDGEELAQRQFKEAFAKMRTEFTSNPTYIEAACSAAETMVANLIKSFNPDIPDLVVEVDFID